MGSNSRDSRHRPCASVSRSELVTGSLELVPKDWWRMPCYWTWPQRRRRICIAVAACWLANAIVVLSVIAFALPSWIIQNPFMLLVFALVFLGPPAWINVSWVYFPGYLFGSNGIGRLLFNDVVQAQVSRNSNAHNGFGVPSLPADLRTPIPRAVGTGLESSNRGFASTPVVWDQHLYVASAIVFAGRVVPKRTCRATLEFGSEGLILSVGRWRPGLVLELPYSAIVGVWNGSDIKTTNSGSVLVVVVAIEHDEILLPFEVARVRVRPNERRTAEALVALLEQHRRNAPTRGSAL